MRREPLSALDLQGFVREPQELLRRLVWTLALERPKLLTPPPPVSAKPATRSAERATR